ncbi:unnamed protein product [Sphagnum balticum]
MECICSRGGGGGGVNQQVNPFNEYWCYQCNRVVTTANREEIICPFCNGGFLEEVENTVPGLDMLLPATLPGMFNNTILESNPLGNAGTADAGATTDPSNSVSLWQGQMQNFLGTGGNVEVFFDNGTGTPRRLPGNFGDYFLGPGLDQLIQQLAENDPNRYGAPPASKTSIDAMPTIHISQEHLGTDAAHCAVCKDEFEMGFPVRQMPCKHMYHAECIMPWLAQHNSCPVCRYEMDTDDADYDQTRAVDPSGVIMSRPRLSFHLPWPFRSSSLQQTSPPSGNAEASASGTASSATGTPDQDSHSGTTPNPPPEAPPGSQNDGDHTTTRLDDLD